MQLLKAPMSSSILHPGNLNFRTTYRFRMEPGNKSLTCMVLSNVESLIGMYTAQILLYKILQITACFCTLEIKFVTDKTRLLFGSNAAGDEFNYISGSQYLKFSVFQS